MERTGKDAGEWPAAGGKYDVVVVGGGPAGVGAALSAARMGARTLIVEQFDCLGGVATAGGHAQMTVFDETGTGRVIVGGIPDEVADRIVAAGYGERRHGSVHFEIEWLKFLYERMMQEAGVDILYYTFFCDTIADHNRVTGVVVQNKNGRQRIEAKQVIDCTGDGDAAAKAGAPFEKGRASDHHCQPVTLMFTIGGVDYERAKSFQREQHDYGLSAIWKKAQDNGDMEPFQSNVMGWWWTPTRPDWVGVNFTHIIHIDSTRAEDLTRATIEGRRQAYHTIDVYRKYVPGMEKCYMVSTPNTIGARESRRIMGEYLLTEEDIQAQTCFPDGICYNSFFIDIHHIDGPGMDKTTWHPPRGFKYTIPYRCLVPQKIDNILTAGRCISVTHLALGSTRVMVQCMATGEAAGAAAALSIRHKTTPRALEPDILLAQLRRQGAIIDEEGIAKRNQEKQEKRTT